jgi:hypothetical protein
MKGVRMSFKSWSSAQKTPGKEKGAGPTAPAAAAPAAQPGKAPAEAATAAKS